MSTVKKRHFWIKCRKLKQAMITTAEQKREKESTCHIGRGQNQVFKINMVWWHRKVKRKIVHKKFHTQRIWEREKYKKTGEQQHLMIKMLFVYCIRFIQTTIEDKPIQSISSVGRNNPCGNHVKIYKSLA